MAQVSIQYSLDKALSSHDVVWLKRTLDEFPGVKAVTVNRADGILCIDYDDTGACKKEIEERLKEAKYSYMMIDQITF